MTMMKMEVMVMMMDLIKHNNKNDDGMYDCDKAEMKMELPSGQMMLSWEASRTTRRALKSS